MSRDWLHFSGSVMWSIKSLDYQILHSEVIQLQLLLNDLCLYQTEILKKVQSLLADPGHPLHGEFRLLPSGCRYSQVTWRTNRLRNSFALIATGLLKHALQHLNVVVPLPWYCMCFVLCVRLLAVEQIVPRGEKKVFFDFDSHHALVDFTFRTITWPHPPETCLQCRWSSRCIHQLCSWYDPRPACKQPGNLAADDLWSTWLCLSETGLQQLRTNSSQRLCRCTPRTWSLRTGSWCETCKRKGTHHIRSVTEEMYKQ